MPFGDALNRLGPVQKVNGNVFLRFLEGQTCIRIIDADEQTFAYLAYPLEVNVNGQRVHRLIPVMTTDNPIAAFMASLPTGDPRKRNPQRRLAFNVVTRPDNPQSPIQSEVKIVDASPSLVDAIAALDGTVRHPRNPAQLMRITDFDIIVSRRGAGLRTTWSCFPIISDFSTQPIAPELLAQRKDPKKYITYFTNEALQALLDGEDYNVVVGRLRATSV